MMWMRFGIGTGLAMVLASQALATEMTCPSKVPEVQKFEIIKLAKHDPLFPLPIRQRTLEMTRFDPVFEFDQGERPYLAVVLPESKADYDLKVVSVANADQTLWRPNFIILNENKQPVRCITQVLTQFVPPTGGRLGRLEGQLSVNFTQNERYLLLYAPDTADGQVAGEGADYPVGEEVSGVFQSLWPWADWVDGQPPKVGPSKTYKTGLYGQISLKMVARDGAAGVH